MDSTKHKFKGKTKARPPIFNIENMKKVVHDQAIVNDKIKRFEEESVSAVKEDIKEEDPIKFF